MGMLNKRGAPDIDFTLLAKRGIIKKPKEIKAVFDFTVPQTASDSCANSSNTLGNLESQVSQNSIATNIFSSLDNPSTGVTSFFNNPSSDSSASLASNGISAEKLAEIDNLKIKLDNLEFKLERMMEKFEAVSSKLLEFERKVS